MSSSFNMQAMLLGEFDVECYIPGDRSVTFKLAEIRHYTQDFTDRISDGHNQVYRGVISGRVDDEKLNGKEIVVKVKVCSRFSEDKREQWKREVALLSRFKGDPHIIQLIGKCSTSERLFLVFPFFSRGDLEHNISDLKLDQALGILEGIAKAIKKLHSQIPPFIYRDLKPSNILLEDNFSPVLADFETVTTADELGNADEKSDVFSFGILMLLVLMKTNLVQERGEIIQAYLLMEEAKSSLGCVTHPTMVDKYCKKDLERLIDVAITCFRGARGHTGYMIVEESLESRPNMKEILKTIQQTREKIADEGTSTHHQAAQPGEGTSTQHQAAQPDEGTSTQHQAAQPDEGTSTHHQAAQPVPDEGTSTHHQAAQPVPDEGTSTHHQAAQPGNCGFEF